MLRLVVLVWFYIVDGIASIGRFVAAYQYGNEGEFWILREGIEWCVNVGCFEFVS